ncbi:MAG: FecR domain-containing protein [Myxococcales bacterium]|nr:FecR domain-containing protein [Myxococcales bacterium]
MAERCVRSREVEALFDHRLDGAAASEMRAHITGCAACARLRAGLAAMRSSLRETAETPNAFVMKRLRREVLEKAESGAAAPRPRLAYARIALAFGAFVFVLAAIGGVRAWLRPAEEAVTVLAAPGAQFSREESGELEIVKLTDGTFDFDVRTHAGGRRLLVVVPDGEIEDIGTQFRVVVQAGATMDISVSSGEVVFRKIGAPPLRLIAGMKYQPLAAVGDASALGVAPTATASTLPPAPPPSSASPSASASAGPPRSVPPSSSGMALRSVEPPSVAARPRPSTTGLASTRAGGAVPSATTSARTDASAGASTAPDTAAPTSNGPAAEDLAYLAVVRLLRGGQTDAARAGARAYLRDFPRGLRRDELTEIAAGRGPTEGK